jgi:subtilisin family serine protease
MGTAKYVIGGFVIFTLIFGTSIPYHAMAQKGGPDFIPGRYIVVLDDGVSPQDVFRGKGIVPDFVYKHALNGFAGPLSPVVVNELKQDSRVLHIEQDQKAYTTAEITPTGIDRIDAEPSSTTSYAGLVTVAIIDTGIDFDHPDLNVVERFDCVGKNWRSSNCIQGQGDDGNGHGTHVAGTVAAINNTEGVVGVVPGADLWSFRVLNNQGSGYYSWIIAGIDEVAANSHLIDVANMSLGGGKSDAVNAAVKNAVDAGVVFVVAAGNESTDASTKSPASAPEAITVSAISDFDGKPGGLFDRTINFSSCTENQDDSFACFSNYGEIVDIAAPGVSIRSTYADGGYATLSGTSMASPHVAGAAAKLIAESTNDLSPSSVFASLLAQSIPSTDTANYFTEDPDSHSEKLLYVGLGSSFNPTLTGITISPNPASVYVGNTLQFTAIGHYEDGAPDADITSSVTWSSLDGTIATIDQTGLVTGMISGSTDIQASLDEIDSDTVSLVVQELPSTKATVSYTLEGGKNADKHLIITVDVDPDLSGVTVAIDLYNGSTLVGSSSGVTNTDGIAGFTLKNAPNGFYTVGVSVDGSLLADDATIDPGFTKS